MKLNTQIPYLEKRMSFEGLEFDYLKDKYKNIAFNWKHWDGSPNHGKYLYATEGFITIPQNYDLNFIKQNFKGLITPNSKFKNLFKNQIEIHVVNGPGYYNNFWIPEKNDFVPFNKKINGICALNNIYHTHQPGDIVHLRPKIFNSINIEKFIKHSYGKGQWGGIHHRGVPSRTPSSPENLKVISNYKFCLCLEPMYHELWSYDWLTERIFDCFKMKTVPIYLGCYNVEDKVPQELYVDLRKFKGINEAINSIKEISEKDYYRMTELGFEFYNQNKIGNILEIEKTLKELN
jgi:hypothetical protein